MFMIINPFARSLKGRTSSAYATNSPDPGEGIKDAKEPDEWDLGIASALVCVTAVLVYRAGNGPTDEHADHARGGCQEQRTSANSVDKLRCGYTHNEREDGIPAIELEAVSIRGLERQDKVSIPQSSGTAT